MTKLYGPPIGTLIGPPDAILGPPVTGVQIGPPVSDVRMGPPVPQIFGPPEVP